ncbi:30S ribosomal protein S2 [Candidatus Jorgensenbacteria bacterium]|nr:30S ribosomal protein S2 [Candidatus Jorgensenbacteria bacterium]
MLDTGVTTTTDEQVMEMARVGVIYGHKKAKTHPRMRPFIGGNRNDNELLDPEATLGGLARAIAFIKEKVANNGSMLLVGTQAAAREAVMGLAEEFKFPYVTTRWLGGTLTNFKVITDRLAYYQNLKVKRESGDLAKYTKKEQLGFSKEIAKLSKMFDGLSAFKKLPDVIFVVDSNIHSTVVHEARLLRIPLVAVIDTDDDPALIDYPIFGNDHSRSSIAWIVDRIKVDLKEARTAEAQNVQPPAIN